MAENDETFDGEYESLKEALIDGVQAIMNLPPVLGEPVWGFMHFDPILMRSGEELTSDEILVTPAFLVTRNGLPVAGALMTEDGGFIVRGIEAEWAGEPEDDPSKLYDDMHLEGL